MEPREKQTRARPTLSREFQGGRMPLINELSMQSSSSTKSPCQLIVHYKTLKNTKGKSVRQLRLIQPDNSQNWLLTNKTKMAATIATSSTVVGLGSGSLSSPSRVSSPRRKICLSSGFVKSAVAARNPLRQAGGSNGGRFMCFERDWLRTDLNVIGFGLIGWLAPSSIPAINGKSLTGLFFESIGTELANFPTPPPLTSPFWLWLVTWHIGLFLCLTFGQIGFKGRSDDYF